MPIPTHPRWQTAGPQWQTAGRVTGVGYGQRVVAAPRFHTSLRLADNRVVVVKIARGQDVGLLRHEAHVLAEIRHPGIVQLVATGGRGTRFGMATAHAGSHTLHTSPTPPLSVAATIAARLFDAIAHLHAVGITHGRIAATHVVVGPGGQAALCGFRSARDLDADGACDDIMQAAQVCASLVESAAGDLPRRNRRRQRELADTCLGLLAEHRLGAAAMAQRLASAVAQRPGAPFPGVQRPGAPPIGAQRPGAPSGSLQAQGHLVGQQSAGDRQHHGVPALGNHQAIKHPGQIIGP